MRRTVYTRRLVPRITLTTFNNFQRRNILNQVRGYRRPYHKYIRTTRPILQPINRRNRNSFLDIPSSYLTQHENPRYQRRVRKTLQRTYGSRMRRRLNLIKKPRFIPQSNPLQTEFYPRQRPWFPVDDDFPVKKPVLSDISTYEISPLGVSMRKPPSEMKGNVTNAYMSYQQIPQSSKEYTLNEILNEFKEIPDDTPQYNLVEYLPNYWPSKEFPLPKSLRGLNRNQWNSDYVDEHLIMLQEAAERRKQQQQPIYVHSGSRPRNYRQLRLSQMPSNPRRRYNKYRQTTINPKTYRYD